MRELCERLVKLRQICEEHHELTERKPAGQNLASTNPRQGSCAQAKTERDRQPIKNFPTVLCDPFVQRVRDLLDKALLLALLASVTLNQWQRADGLLDKGSHLAVRLMRGKAA